MRKFVLMVLLSLVSWQFSYAQEMLVRGVVTSAKDGMTIPGVSIVVKGTAFGTTTDYDGNFQIKVEKGATLVFSYIGMKNFEVVIGSNASINVALSTDNVAMDEVVVVGYGVQKKSDVTGAVSSVNKKALADQPVSSAATLLQGRASGVQVTQTSGAPGGGLTVRVRGTGTVNNASPLYVVDGILLDNINHINPSDIKSMEVLKDASATAIYGSRGANGVILITTKVGDSEDVRVQLELMSGVQSVWNEPDLVSSSQWLEMYNESQSNAAVYTGSTAYKPLELMSPSDDKNSTTDWFDEVTRMGKVHKTNVTVSQGNEKSNTLFSAGYFKNEGVVLNSSYERINARLNTNYTISPIFKTGVNISLSNADTDQVTSSAVSGILTLAQRLDPLTPVRQESGEFASTPYSDLQNPVAQLNRDVRESSSLLLLANSYLQVEPVKNLVARSAISLNLSRSKSKTFLPSYNYGNEKRLTNSLSKTTREFNGFLSENTITYSLDKGVHNLNVMAGFTVENNKSEYLGAARGNIPNNNEELQYISASTDLESTTAWNSGQEIKMYSYLGRVNYNYADKYFVTATMRRDGSSVFGPEKRFGNFPSTSLGWKMRNESFMDFIPEDIVNRMKIRAGWGRVGNAKIDPYTFASTVQSKDSKVEYSYVFGDKEQAGAAPVKMANTKVQWETVESTNIGVDLGFLGDKVTFTADYFVKETKDMLVRVPIPTYAGYDGSPFVNAGSVENKGFEFNLGYKGKIGSDFNYSVNVNASHVENEVTSLGGGVPIWSGSASLIGSTTRTAEGHPIGAFYGYEVAGVFQSQAEADASAQSGEGLGAGDFKFVDQWTDKDGDGVLEEPDGVINGDDRTYIGDPNPDLFYGVNIDMNYKGFDLSMFFQGVSGNEIFNAFKYYNYADHKRYALSSDRLNYWTAENGSNTQFGLNAATNQKNLRASDFYVEDGSYLRLKNIQLGYTFKKIAPWMSSLRLYFSGQNVFTLTKYSGLDPEIGSSSTLSQGVDYGTYPQSRIFSFGANLTF